MYFVTNNKEQFEQNLRELCLHKSYNNEKQPGSVENIILTDRNKYLAKQMDLLSYFLYHFQNFRNLEDIKLLEYVCFIRNERNKMFPNNYRVAPRKYISNTMFKRSSTLQDYIECYVLNNANNRAKFKLQNKLIRKVGLIRKGFKQEVDLEIIVSKSNKNETNDERILRLLGSEYEIRRTNTDEAIGMLESDVVHGNVSNDVVILVKKRKLKNEKN